MITARNTTSGVLAGIGLIAFVDETVFHQLLHWHHFYDKSTLEVGLVSDGLFHALGFFATVAGLFLLADLRRRRSCTGCAGRRAVHRRRRLPALRRPGPAQADGAASDPLPRRPDPYDITWNIGAATMIIVGWSSPSAPAAERAPAWVTITWASARRC